MYGLERKVLEELKKLRETILQIPDYGETLPASTTPLIQEFQSYLDSIIKSHDVLDPSGCLIEVHYKASPPFVIASAEFPDAVEGACGKFGLSVGEAWWDSHPDQKLADGRWLLYLSPGESL